MEPPDGALDVPRGRERDDRPVHDLDQEEEGEQRENVLLETRGPIAIAWLNTNPTFPYIAASTRWRM